jgi:hypothetical protein
MRRRIFDDFGNNYSVNFDGTNDFVSAGSASSFNYYHGATAPTTFAFSIGFWVKFVNPNANAAQTIIVNAPNAVNVGILLLFDSRTAQSRSRTLIGQISRGVTGAVNTVVFAVSANNVYPNSTGWHHILWTYNQALANSNSLIYVDGTLVNTTNKTGQTPSTANATNTLSIGAIPPSTSPLNGNIFNVFFAQGVITSGERTALLANPKASPQAVISSAFISNAYRFPQGQGNFPTWVDAYGGVSGDMTNQTSANIQLDTP